MKKVINRIFGTKEPEPPKKTVSLAEKKIQYNMFMKKTDDSIREFETMLQSTGKRAYELVEKGLDASIQVKEIRTYKRMISELEKRKSLLMQLFNRNKVNEINRSFMIMMGDMVKLMCEDSDSSIDYDKMTSEIENGLVNLAAQDEKIASAIENFDSVSSAYSGSYGAELSEEEALIKQKLEDAYRDAKNDPNYSREEASKKFLESIMV